MFGACRAELARFVVLEGGWLELYTLRSGLLGRSTSEESGVVGRDVAALKAGRSSDVSEGDGGSGVGGLL